MTENDTQKSYMDAPDDYERRAIDRHPLTQRLNRELLACFERNSHLMRSKRRPTISDVPDSEKIFPASASSTKK
jgi:hypothetical protein